MTQAKEKILMDMVFYIEAVRIRNDTLHDETGNRQRFFVRTYGCQMNMRESENIEGVLLAMGYIPAADEENADIVIYNTCCVRENAENKVYGSLGHLKTLKEARPGMVVVLCGCMAQLDNVMELVLNIYRHVDIVFGTFTRRRFPYLLHTFLETRKRVFDTKTQLDDTPEALQVAQAIEGNGCAGGTYPPAYNSGITLTARKHTYKTGVNVMYGCNNFCTYCIVPYVRGRERSRSPEDILAEVRALAADGVREVMLLGQNVNNYGAGLDADASFADLLRQVSLVEGIERIRFTTSHPKDLSDALILAIQSSDKICKHIHLPFQAGGNLVLRRMNRRYGKEDYLELCKRIKKAIPGAAISTDIIVGFPGETEEDFGDTLDVVRQVGFSGAFTFLYSPRMGTPAAKMDSIVQNDVAIRRFNELLAVLNPMLLARNQKRVGEVERVMVEDDPPHTNGYITGRAEDNTPVHFATNGSDLPGDIRDVRIEEAKTFYLTGKII